MIVKVGTSMTAVAKPKVTLIVFPDPAVKPGAGMVAVAIAGGATRTALMLTTGTVLVAVAAPALGRMVKFVCGVTNEAVD